MNGVDTIYAGRPMPTIYGGRPMPTVLAGASAPMPAIWPRTNGMCAAVVACCCKGPINVGPGEIATFSINWAPWLNTIPGYKVHAIASASLFDMMESPPVPPDPTIIKVTTSVPGADPVPVDNADVASLISLIPPFGTQVAIEAGLSARIGDQYKLNICITARDCDGRTSRQCDCFVIVISDCG